MLVEAVMQRSLVMGNHSAILKGAGSVTEQITKDGAERRTHHRIAVSELLFFSHHGTVRPLARMENISRGGLLFVTDQCLEAFPEPLRIDIYWGINAYCLKDIQCRVVWGEVRDQHSDEGAKRCLVRGGLQFVEQTALQRAQMEYLMIILGDNKKGINSTSAV